eukprot:g1340.t1
MSSPMSSPMSSALPPAPPQKFFAATRLHRPDASVDAGQLLNKLRRVIECVGGAKCDGFLVAYPLWDGFLRRSIDRILKSKQRRFPQLKVLEPVPVPYWGSFTPALSCIVSAALAKKADLLMVLSLEMIVNGVAVDILRSYLTPGKTLVVGPALANSHLFGNERNAVFAMDEDEDEKYCQNSCERTAEAALCRREGRNEPKALEREEVGNGSSAGSSGGGAVIASKEKSIHFVVSGANIPWNTCAIWDLKKLSLFGFPSIADGHLPNVEKGIEEVVAINVAQASLGVDNAEVKLVRIAKPAQAAGSMAARGVSGPQGLVSLNPASANASSKVVSIAEEGAVSGSATTSGNKDGRGFSEGRGRGFSEEQEVDPGDGADCVPICIWDTFGDEWINLMQTGASRTLAREVSHMIDEDHSPLAAPGEHLQLLLPPNLPGVAPTLGVALQNPSFDKMSIHSILESSGGAGSFKDVAGAAGSSASPLDDTGGAVVGSSLGALPALANRPLSGDGSGPASPQQPASLPLHRVDSATSVASSAGSELSRIIFGPSTRVSGTGSATKELLRRTSPKGVVQPLPRASDDGAEVIANPGTGASASTSFVQGSMFTKEQEKTLTREEKHARKCATKITRAESQMRVLQHLSPGVVEHIVHECL